MYSKRVIDYYTQQDTSEIENLASLIDSGEFDEQLKGMSKKAVESFKQRILNVDPFSDKELEILKAINHVAAFILLAHQIETK